MQAKFKKKFTLCYKSGNVFAGDALNISIFASLHCLLAKYCNLAETKEYTGS